MILRAGTPVATSDVVINSGGTTTTTFNESFDQSGTGLELANLTVGDLDTSVNNAQRAGNVILSAPGKVTAGDINASAIAAAGGGAVDAFGGNVAIQAGGNITVGFVSTVAENFGFGLAQAGSVLMTAGEDLNFGAIQAEGISLSPLGPSEGIGGTVQLTATGLVRGQAIVDPVNPANQTTIDTTGNSQSGPILITHGGGADNIPFVVGDAAAANGTAAKLQSGESVVLNQSFPNLGRETAGISDPPSNEISITFTNQAPVLEGDRTIITETNTDLSLTLAELNLDITDSDGDNTTVELDGIGAGATLSRGGVPLNPGDAIAPSDTLTYSPPADTSGSVLAFSLRSSDRLEISNTIDITASIDSVGAPIDPPPVTDPAPPAPGPTTDPAPGPDPVPGPIPDPTPAPNPPVPDPIPVPAPPDPEPPAATPLVVTPEPSIAEPPNENSAPDLSLLQLLGQLGDSLGQDLQAQPDGSGHGGVLESLPAPEVQGIPLAAFPDTQAQALSDLTIFSAMVPEASLALLPNSAGGIDPTILKQNDINTPDIPAIGSIKDWEISTISGPVGDFPGDSGDGLVSEPGNGGTTSAPQPGYEPDVPLDIPQSGTPISAPQPGIEPDVPGGAEGAGSNNPGSGNAGNPPVGASSPGQTSNSSLIASATGGEQPAAPSASDTNSPNNPGSSATGTGSSTSIACNTGGTGNISPSADSSSNITDNSIRSEQASSAANPVSANPGSLNPASANPDSSNPESVSTGNSVSGNSVSSNSVNRESAQSKLDATSSADSKTAAADGPQTTPKAGVQGAGAQKEQSCQTRVAQASYEQISTDPADAEQKPRTAEANPSAAASKSEQQGHYRSLVTCYQTTLAQARQAQDSGSQLTALNNLGIAHFVLGEYLQAIEVHQQQLQQAQAEGDRTQIGIAWAGLGAAHAALGDYDRAIDEYQQSLENLPDSKRVQPWRSLTLRNLGNAYLSQKDYSQALQYQQQALDLSKSVGDRYGEMQALGNLANVYALDAKFDRALEYYQQNLTLARSQNIPLEQAQALLGLGTTYAFLKDYRQAIDYNQQSLALVRSLDNRLSEGILLTNLGDAHYQLGELDPAERYLRQSIDVWEGLRAGLGTNDSYKISIFETQLAAYRNLQEVLIDQQKAGEALEIAERGRSRAFLELLARGSAAEDAALAPPNLEQLKAIAREQNATVVEYTIAREQFADVPNGAALQYTGEAVPSKLLIWVLKPSGDVQVRQVDLLDWQIQQQQSLPGLVSVARRCMDDLSCTRLFNRRQRRALARALAQRGLNPKQVARAQQSNLQPSNSQSTDAFGNGVGNSQNSSQNSLQQLHGLLIEPIADLLPQDPSDRIVFVPQEQLFLVPFPALQASDGSYLIDKHTVTTAPSIQLLDATRRRRQQLAQQSGASQPSDKQNAKPSSTANGTALVVGNPAPMPAKFSPLPFTATEAATIGQVLDAQPLIGAAATEAAVKRQLPQARWIHLATHGIFDPQRPLDGAIILAPGAQAEPSGTAVFDATNTSQDGLLAAGEIMDLSLQAEMVILSACDTGQGRITGDGVIGLSRSFLGAGAASVLVSLWQVPDDATASLMTEFYQQRQQLDYAQALRQAMLTVKADYSDPKSWAGFTLIGEVE